jgi:dipeptide/tripeptide permease
MAKTQYLTAPLKTDGFPPGIFYIIGNEAAERFSYYGMNSILVIFMTHRPTSGITRSSPPPIFCRSSARFWPTRCLASIV